MPTHQCLEPDHLAINLYQRLIVKTKLVPRDGGAELVLNSAPLTDPVIHFGFEKARLATTIGLSAVERGLSIVE